MVVVVVDDDDDDDSNGDDDGNFLQQIWKKKNNNNRYFISWAEMLKILAVKKYITPNKPDFPARRLKIATDDPMKMN